MQWKTFYFGRQRHFEFSYYDMNKNSQTEIIINFSKGYDAKRVNVVSDSFRQFSPNQTNTIRKIIHSKNGYELIMQYSSIVPEILLLSASCLDKFMFINSSNKDKKLFGKVDVIFLN